MKVSLSEWKKSGVLDLSKTPMEIISRAKEAGLDRLFKIAEDFRVKHSKGGACYLSIDEWVYIYDTSVVSNDDKSPGDMFGIISAAVWRIGKIIYRFDEELRRALIDTHIKYVPSDVLRQLPVTCTYVELDVKLFHINIHGFFAQFNNCDGNLLSIVMLSNAGIMPIEIDLNAGTVERAIVGMERVDPGTQMHEFFMQATSVALSLLVYLCSVGADFKNAPTSETKRDKRTNARRFVAAKHEQIVCVGERIGATLRAMRRDYESHSSSGGAVRSVIPHIRRAHWHTFLTGPRAGERVPVIKWIPPTLVNADSHDDLAVTIRPVK